MATIRSPRIRSHRSNAVSSHAHSIGKPSDFEPHPTEEPTISTHTHTHMYIQYYTRLSNVKQLSQTTTGPAFEALRHGKAIVRFKVASEVLLALKTCSGLLVMKRVRSIELRH